MGGADGFDGDAEGVHTRHIQCLFESENTARCGSLTGGVGDLVFGAMAGR